MHYHTKEYNVEEMKTLLVPDDSYDLANVQIINHIFVQKHILHTDHEEIGGITWALRKRQNKLEKEFVFVSASDLCLVGLKTFLLHKYVYRTPKFLFKSHFPIPVINGHYFSKMLNSKFIFHTTKNEVSVPGKYIVYYSMFSNIMESITVNIINK